MRIDPTQFELVNLCDDEDEPIKTVGIIHCID